MRAKILALFSPLVLLAACGGGGGGGSDTKLPDYQGVWYNIDPFNYARYLNPTVFAQNGRDIVVRNCDRSTINLRLEGDQLVFSDGTAFGWRLAGEDTMTGKFGASAGAEMRRFSKGTLFESGRVSLGVPSLAPLQATQDVCAQSTGETYTLAPGAEMRAVAILITAPHLGSHAHVRLTFQTLRTGDFVARDRAGFLQNADSSVLVELKSPSYVPVYGQDTLKISSGNVRVGRAASGAYTFDGSLVTEGGAQVPLSAEVTLERRP